MHPVKTLGRLLFSALPENNDYLLRFCRKYVDRANGDNDFVPETNGEYRFLQRMLPRLRNGVVFDIGANIGDWSAHVIASNPSLTVHCFEPSASTFSRLRDRGWPGKVHLNDFALGDTEGTATLNVVSDGSGMNSIYLRKGLEAAAPARTETIRISTVDHYCDRVGVSRIDLAKIDVEGHELAVLKGMSRMLAGSGVSLIQFEYGGCNLDSRVPLRDIWDYLEPYEFQLYKLFPRGPKLIPCYSQQLETFQYSNWVAAKKGYPLD